MPAVEVRTFIPAPPDAVWETLADLEGQASWMTDVIDLRVTSERKEGVGATMAIASRVLFKTVRETATVTAWDPPRSMAVRHSGDFGGAGIFTLEPAPGGTIFIWREELRPPFGPLGLLAFPLVRPHLVRLFARNSDRLREAVLARKASRPGPRRPGARRAARRPERKHPGPATEQES